MIRTKDLYDRVVKHVRHGDLDYCREYGEPGYSDPEGGILFANWNDTPRRLMDVLERNGFELEWSDEWIVEHESGKAYRTSPDSYFWRPSYVMTESGDIIGLEDILDNESMLEDYIELHLNNPRRAATFRTFNPTACGFVKFNGTFESGWHPGQTDDPKKVARQMETQFPNHDYLFVLSETSQFYSRWEVWLRLQGQED